MLSKIIEAPPPLSYISQWSLLFNYPPTPPVIEINKPLARRTKQMIILRYLKPLSPSSCIVLLFGRLKKCCLTVLPREFSILSGVFLLCSTWSLFRFTWLNSVLLFVFFRPCKEFSPSRLLLSHLGLLSIEGLMVKQYCYSVCAFLKGFCQTYSLFLSIL